MITICVLRDIIKKIVYKIFQKVIVDMEKQKTKIISIAAIIALVITLVAATYAYFVAQTGEGSQTDIKINANTVDTLSFETDSAISLSIDQENFANNTGNQVGSTFAKAILTANNKTNTATEHYYLYLNINNNTFTYTQNENTPEILLTIKDGSNNEITSIDGLTYKTVTDGKGATVKGFDITTKTGLVSLFNNREITTTSTKTEQWNITVTFINYNADQSANAGKSFSAKLIIQKDEYKIPTLAEYVISQYTGTQGENSIYYHDSTLANGAGDNSYRYAGPSDSVNNFVCFGSTATPCPTDNLYRIIGVIDDKVKLIKYDYASSILLGTDGDYSQNAEEAEMPTDYYKGTKEMSEIGFYYWNYKATNTWSTSLLNKTNLNTNYINYIGEEWANKIAMTTWKVGGNTWANIGSAIPSVAYQNEITNPDATNSTDNATEYQAKIGLMYVSDYGFAASPSAWTEIMNNYENVTSNNWMFMGAWEWTISRNAGNSGDAFIVNVGGSVVIISVSNCIAVRPSFNLESSVNYVSGSGSMSDPIVIN